MTFTLSANDDPGLPYLAGTSFGKGPIPLGTRTLGLSLDPLLQVSNSGAWPTIFRNYVGLIGANGTAAASINIPGQAGLIGLRLHTAFLSFDGNHPLGIKSISDTATVTVTN